jgi:hypothetical protein
MNRSFSRSIETSSLFRGVGAPLASAAPRYRGSPNAGAGAHLAGAAKANLSGVGAMTMPEGSVLATYALTSGLMYYGVMLAIKGSLLYGGLAFIGGPLAVGLAMQAMSEA